MERPAADMLLRPAGRFVKRYIIQGGFLDGAEGLMITGIDAYVTFLKYARLWEMERTQGPPDATPRS